MAYTNKTYVCFDADSDMHYYRLMTAWKENDRFAFNFHNAHYINNLRDGSSEVTIKSKLRERLANTKILVVLIGRSTKNLYKYVRWEIEYAIENDIPIVAVNLNGRREMDSTLCPPLLRNELALHVNFSHKIINKVLNEWPAAHAKLRREGKRTDYRLTDSVYNSI